MLRPYLVNPFWDQPKENPDKPHEKWALEHFQVETYEQAAQKVADKNGLDGSELKESFADGYWTISDPWHEGTGKTKDAALIDYAFDERYNREPDW